MMDITIRDGHMAVVINTRGAELKSVKNERLGLEYLWQGDPGIWADHAPFLFPVVARQLDDEYMLGGRKYTMPMHGFAKDLVFTVTEKTPDSVTMELHEDEQTLVWYPFRFCLRTIFRISGHRLSVRHEVTNESLGDMPYSLGEHPGFNVPMVAGEILEDHYLEFSCEEKAQRWYLEDEIISGAEPCLDGKVLPIDRHTFDRGALIFKKLQSDSVTLHSRNHSHSVTMELAGWDYLGIWAKPGAPYVCIEPWNGLASSRWSSHDIWQKEGIRCLKAGETAEHTMNISFV